MRKFVIVCILFCLSGCSTLTPWTQLKTGQYTDKARGFKAVMPEGWMRFNLAKYFLMTRDGTVLNNIIVEKHQIDKKLEFTKKEFFKDMTIQDLAGIEIDDFESNNNISKFKIIENKPNIVDGVDSFRIEYTYLNENGLKIHGIQYGFIYKKDWVYSIRYEAASQNYYNKYLKDFQNFVSSFRLILN